MISTITIDGVTHHDIKMLKVYTDGYDKPFPIDVRGISDVVITGESIIIDLDWGFIDLAMSRLEAPSFRVRDREIELSRLQHQARYLRNNFNNVKAIEVITDIESKYIKNWVYDRIHMLNVKRRGVIQSIILGEPVEYLTNEIIEEVRISAELILPSYAHGKVPYLFNIERNLFESVILGDEGFEFSLNKQVIYQAVLNGNIQLYEPVKGLFVEGPDYINEFMAIFDDYSSILKVDVYGRNFTREFDLSTDDFFIKPSQNNDAYTFDIKVNNDNH